MCIVKQGAFTQNVIQGGWKFPYHNKRVAHKHKQICTMLSANQILTSSYLPYKINTTSEMRKKWEKGLSLNIWNRVWEEINIQNLDVVDHVAQTYTSLTILLRLVHNFKSFFLLIGVSTMSCFGHQLRCKHKVLFLAIVHKYIEDAEVDKAYINNIYAHCNKDCICETSRQKPTTTRIVSSFLTSYYFFFYYKQYKIYPILHKTHSTRQKKPNPLMFQSPQIQVTKCLQIHKEVNLLLLLDDLSTPSTTTLNRL